MLAIQDTIVSFDVIREFFCCDVTACNGACCFDGDSGAPLEEKEKQQIEEDLEKIVPFMEPSSVEVVRQKGVAYTDQDGDLVTQLKGGQECAFAIKKDGIWQCAIEIAHSQGQSRLRKPISCALYPIRLSSHPTFTAVEYHRWSVCKAAVIKGQLNKIRVYQFLKQPLIDRFGQAWYSELETAAEIMEKEKITK